jgi:hypothetical protein
MKVRVVQATIKRDDNVIANGWNIVIPVARGTAEVTHPSTRYSLHGDTAAEIATKMNATYARALDKKADNIDALAKRLQERVDTWQLRELLPLS